MDLTLGRMELALSAHGLTRLPCLCCQVLGTNGKGSTSAYLAELGQAHGLKTLLFTSPHFLTPRERLRIGGAMLGEPEWLSLANQAFTRPGADNLTYFELLTLMAALAAREYVIDFAIFEAGLGGRFDSTSALWRDILLYAPIGLDHQAVLGKRLKSIAQDKAVAMRQGQFALSGAQPLTALAELRRAANEAGIELASSRQALPKGLGRINPGLAGPHQRANARLALAGFAKVAETIGLDVSAEAARQALARTFLPGRLQRVSASPELILDSAHNPPALRCLAKALKSEAIAPQALIFTALRDKNLKDVASLARELVSGPILVPELPGCDRATPAAGLAKLLGGRARPVADLAAALESLKGSSGPLLVCGSMYLLAEYYKLFPQTLNLR